MKHHQLNIIYAGLLLIFVTFNYAQSDYSYVVVGEFWNGLIDFIVFTFSQNSGKLDIEESHVRRYRADFLHSDKSSLEAGLISLAAGAVRLVREVVPQHNLPETPWLLRFEHRLHKTLRLRRSYKPIKAALMKMIKHAAHNPFVDVNIIAPDKMAQLRLESLMFLLGDSISTGMIYLGGNAIMDVAFFNSTMGTVAAKQYAFGLGSLRKSVLAGGGEICNNRAPIDSPCIHAHSTLMYETEHCNITIAQASWTSSRNSSDNCAKVVKNVFPKTMVPVKPLSDNRIYVLGEYFKKLHNFFVGDATPKLTVGDIQQRANKQCAEADTLSSSEELLRCMDLHILYQTVRSLGVANGSVLSVVKRINKSEPLWTLGLAIEHILIHHGPKMQTTEKDSVNTKMKRNPHGATRSTRDIRPQGGHREVQPSTPSPKQIDDAASNRNDILEKPNTSSASKVTNEEKADNDNADQIKKNSSTKVETNTPKDPLLNKNEVKTNLTKGVSNTEYDVVDKTKSGKSKYKPDTSTENDTNVERKPTVSDSKLKELEMDIKDLKSEVKEVTELVKANRQNKTPPNKTVTASEVQTTTHPAASTSYLQALSDPPTIVDISEKIAKKVMAFMQNETLYKATGGKDAAAVAPTDAQHVTSEAKEAILDKLTEEREGVDDLAQLQTAEAEHMENELNDHFGGLDDKFYEEDEKLNMLIKDENKRESEHVHVKDELAAIKHAIENMSLNVEKLVSFGAGERGSGSPVVSVNHNNGVRDKAHEANQKTTVEVHSTPTSSSTSGGSKDGAAMLELLEDNDK